MTDYAPEIEPLEPRGRSFGPDTMRELRAAQKRARWMGTKELAVGFGLFLFLVVVFVGAILFVANWTPKP